MLSLEREQEARCEVFDVVYARDEGVIVNVGLVKVPVDEEGQVPDHGEPQPAEEEGGGEHEEDPPPVEVNDRDEYVLICNQTHLKISSSFRAF